MKLKSILLIVGTILGVTHSANSQNQLVTYPAPEGAELMRRLHRPGEGSRKKIGDL